MRITDDFERREVAMLAVKMEMLGDDVGLASTEIEQVIGLPGGAWPMPKIADNKPLAVEHETRLRYLLEICERVRTLFEADAKRWFRMRNPGLGVSPLEFLECDMSALRALRDALRAEMRGC